MNEGLSVQDLKRFTLQLFDGQEEALKSAEMSATPGIWSIRGPYGRADPLLFGGLVSGQSEGESACGQSGKQDAKKDGKADSTDADCLYHRGVGGREGTGSDVSRRKKWNRYSGLVILLNLGAVLDYRGLRKHKALSFAMS